jgi:hypothetical protein
MTHRSNTLPYPTSPADRAEQLADIKRQLKRLWLRVNYSAYFERYRDERKALRREIRALWNKIKEDEAQAA